MSSAVHVWQSVVALAGLAAVLLAVADIAWNRVRSGSFTAAMEANWLTHWELRASLGPALLGWVLGVLILRHGAWDSSVILAMVGSLLFATVYWLITRGGMSVVLMLLLIFVLPAANGFVASA
jgi:hypothetical protein